MEYWTTLGAPGGARPTYRTTIDTELDQPCTALGAAVQSYVVLRDQELGGVGTEASAACGEGSTGTAVHNRIGRMWGAAIVALRVAPEVHEDVLHDLREVLHDDRFEGILGDWLATLEELPADRALLEACAHVRSRRHQAQGATEAMRSLWSRCDGAGDA